MKSLSIVTEDGVGNPDGGKLRDGDDHRIESELITESMKLYSEMQPGNTPILLIGYIVGIKRSA